MNCLHFGRNLTKLDPQLKKEGWTKKLRKSFFLIGPVCQTFGSEVELGVLSEPYRNLNGDVWVTDSADSPLISQSYNLSSSFSGFVWAPHQIFYCQNLKS